jgi:hypothetical protein
LEATPSGEKTRPAKVQTRHRRSPSLYSISLLLLSTFSPARLTEEMNGQIFISYRREESRWLARSLHDRLSARFDQKRVFMDIEDIPLGDDIVKEIEDRVGACDVLIAVIGTDWLTSKDEHEGRRLDNPEDFVRMEIATALKRDVLVIPVLVDGTLMPRSIDLPDDLKALVRRNALRLSETGFNDDCRRLIAAIEQVLEKGADPHQDSEEEERLETECKQVVVRDRRAERDRSDALISEIQFQISTWLTESAIKHNRYTLTVDVIEHRSFFTNVFWNASTQLKWRVQQENGLIVRKGVSVGKGRRFNTFGHLTAREVSNDAFYVAMADLKDHCLAKT